MQDDYYLIDGIEYKWPDRPASPPVDNGDIVEDADSGMWFIW